MHGSSSLFFFVAENKSFAGRDPEKTSKDTIGRALTIVWFDGAQHGDEYRLTPQQLDQGGGLVSMAATVA